MFPGKGNGPGFSLCCRPSALDRTLNLWARRIFCMHFYGVSEYEVTFASIFTGFAESRLWECRVFSFKIARTSQKSRVFPFTFAPSCRQSHVLCVFPGEGIGPGFSFSCRPSALTAPWIWARVGFFCMHFYRVFWIWGDFCMHFYRVCWIPLMGMSCFLVQNCTHFTKVSCFSVHFCSRPSQITWFACKFAYICVILCVGGAWGVWQFLWRVDVCMQIYSVLWEPFMGM